MAAVWIIDGNHWERVGIRAQLIEQGYRVEGFASVSRAIAGLRLGIFESPALVILELHGLACGESELDELARTGVPILLLTGVFEKRRELSADRTWAAVLCRPFTVGQVTELVEKILG